MCCFDKMLLSADTHCFQQEMLECFSRKCFSSVSSVSFIVQLIKWLHLHLAVEPIVFSKSSYRFPSVPGQRLKNRGKMIPEVARGMWGMGGWGVYVSNFVCLKIALKYL